MAFHVRDYQVRWKNFRAFRDTGWITLRPLTIILGPNNSGKSNLSAPLLLMSQTSRSADARPPLVTRGALIDVGPIQNIAHNGDITKPIYFGFKFHLHQKEKNPKPVGEYPPGVLEFSIRAGKEIGQSQLIKYELSDALERPFVRLSKARGAGYRLTAMYQPKMRAGERKIVESVKPTNFLISPSGVLQAERSKTRELSSSKMSEGFGAYLSIISFAFTNVSGILDRLAYVGPLRDRLRRYYEVDGAAPASVGTRGQDMANLIRRKSDAIQPRLDAWVERFGFGKKLIIENISRELFSLMLQSGSDPESTANVADSGFGVSQVLPLIVQALTAPKYSLTIAEQPEIHLNPRAQSILADLFAEMVNDDHRIVVETHSEHLLLRLRRLIANGTLDAGSVAIYFVEKGDGESTIREIPLQRDGSILPIDWPKGFFDDSLRESLALAAAQSKIEKTRQPKVATGAKKKAKRRTAKRSQKRS